MKVKFYIRTVLLAIISVEILSILWAIDRLRGFHVYWQWVLMLAFVAGLSFLSFWVKLRR